jgi:hypothetical protein
VELAESYEREREREREREVWWTDVVRWAGRWENGEVGERAKRQNSCTLLLLLVPGADWLLIRGVAILDSVRESEEREKFIHNQIDD